LSLPAEVVAVPGHPLVAPRRPSRDRLDLESALTRLDRRWSRIHLPPGLQSPTTRLATLWL